MQACDCPLDVTRNLGAIREVDSRPAHLFWWNVGFWFLSLRLAWGIIFVWIGRRVAVDADRIFYHLGEPLPWKCDVPDVLTFADQLTVRVLEDGGPVCVRDVGGHASCFGCFGDLDPGHFPRNEASHS